MSHLTSHILMIRPVSFDFNEQTAASNSFQNKTESKNSQQNALLEFDAFVDVLRGNGVQVTVLEDTPEPHTPDSIFPNNWVSFHENNRVFLYPMQAINRRQERRTDVIEQLAPQAEITDLSSHELQNRFLEGTGSMVLDRKNKLAYACLSPRTDAGLVNEFCLKAGYRSIVFDAVDESGKPIYHTNVLMCIGDGFAVICLDAIPNELEKEAVKEALTSTGHELISIDYNQMNRFAGNMLQLKNTYGDSLLILSSEALGSLHPAQIERLSTYAKLVSSPIPTIETLGGGSVRCMMAEVF